MRSIWLLIGVFVTLMSCGVHNDEAGFEPIVESRPDQEEYLSTARQSDIIVTPKDEEHVRPTDSSGASSLKGFTPPELIGNPSIQSSNAFRDPVIPREAVVKVEVSPGFKNGSNKPYALPWGSARWRSGGRFGAFEARVLPKRPFPPRGPVSPLPGGSTPLPCG